MTDTMTPFTMAWGALPGDDEGQYQAKINSADDLTTTWDKIHTAAARAGLVQQVDAMTRGRTITPYGEADPLIQVLIGHPDRSSLIWHEAEDSYLATEAGLAPLSEPIIYDRGGQTDEMDPGEVLITPATAQRILSAFLKTGARPRDVAWEPL